jgi:hypothetical protein
MKRYLALFTQALFAMATVVGLYLAAVAINLTWIFWLVIVASLAFAASRLIWPHIVAVFRAWRTYPSMVSRVKQLEGQVASSSEKLTLSAREVQRLTEAIDEAASLGAERGRSEAIGEFLASAVAIPRIVQLADYDGQISLVVETTDGVPPLTARYHVKVKRTGQLRGIVEVVDVDHARGIAYLICVVSIMPDFWVALSEKVLTDSTPPRDIILETISLPELAVGPIEPELQKLSVDQKGVENE